MRFRYLRDPLFLLVLTSYFVNRLLLKPYLPNVISQSYWNDLICIPFWVPIQLFLARSLGLRPDDAPPRAHEILVPLLVWSALFELFLPYTASFRGVAIADPVDVLCYCAGALAAALAWRPRSRTTLPGPPAFDT
jgi:hypothetical protein